MFFTIDFIAGLVIGATVAPVLTIVYLSRPVSEEKEQERDTRRPVEEAAKDLARSLGLHWLEMTEAERQKMRNATEEVVARFASETSAA